MSVDGATVTKPGSMAAQDAVLDVAGDSGRYVSRAAVKLLAALDAFGFDPAGRDALDVGASTGGFTQVLLERAAAHVIAVDVGRDQLREELRADRRVTVLESTDARGLTPALVSSPVTAIVADVSFISLTKALPAALEFAKPGCWLVALVKPQFEAGREAVGKGGVVRDAAARQSAVEKVRAWLAAQPGWAVTGLIESPLRGADGNLEFLLGATFNP